MADTIYGSLQVGGQHALPKAYTELLLRGLIEHFRLPSPLAVPVYGGWILERPVPPRTFLNATPESVTVAISAEVLFTLKHDGRLENPRLVASSLSSSLDERLLHAVSTLDSTRAMPPFPGSVHTDAVPVFFTADLARDSVRVSAPLFTAAMPIWMMDQPVHAKRGEPVPQYPWRLESNHLEGEVLLSFVVDHDGVPRMETVRVRRATSREFAKSVFDVLPKWRFVPARINGCPVAQLVEMPFAFRIAR